MTRYESLNRFESGCADDPAPRFGKPDDRWKMVPSMRYDRFIEVQVWDDGPIKRFLKRNERDGTCAIG